MKTTRTVLIPALLGAALGAGGAPAQAKDIREPGAILTEIDGLIQHDVEKWCADQGIAYPPAAVVLRIFKQEHELEIWAKNADQKKMRLVRARPICAMDFAPGPKLAEGDGKTPEGFYHPEFGYKSSMWWMWMDLDADQVEEPGQVGKGSCFKMCLEYPNRLDRLRSKAAGFKKPGGDICIHGNCVSIGCASFKNRDFLPVFAFARHHDQNKFGKLQVHIFPFRFERVGADGLAQAAQAAAHVEALGRERLLSFWANLKEGYDKFNADPNPLGVSLGKEKYEFR
jgi:murein L,D-transpeptidase YafK